MGSRKNINPFILFFIILLLWQCKEKEEDDIRMITFQGSQVQRLSDSYAHFSVLDSLSYGSLMIHDGDLVSTDEFYFSIRGDLLDTLRFKRLDSLMYINGDLAGISISKDGPPLSFFEQLSTDEISHLRTIQFVKPIWDSIKPYLEKIAHLNPTVDICYISEIDSISLLNKDLFWLSKYFKPKVLLLGNETDSISFSSLTKFPSLESVMTSLPINGDGYFPHLPHLKDLVLGNNENSIPLGSEFFREIADLESLTIIVEESANIDWTSLDKLKNLRKLSIETDSIILNDIYGHHPHLQSLHLGVYNEGVSISDIFNKNKLKWLSLYPADEFLIWQKSKVLQDSFPELEYLEFENKDSLLDYRNFKNIKKLKYLVIQSEVGLDSTLHNLDHLRYLSLSHDFLKDSVNVARLQRALPNTVIAPNSGACLGSGWLLVIIPLAGLWFYFLKPKKSRNL
ncbi:hypothetical protein [Tamlana flava]|uniref:hypothetical protein n=1 Tax=Tamlana flava TaxID=3158572 RepID=UPI00351B00BD